MSSRSRGAMVFVLILFLIIISLSVVSLYDFIDQLRLSAEVVQAEAELRKIGVASLGIFLSTRRVDSQRLWSQLGGVRRDVWGRAYQKRGQGENTEWGSSGADGQFGTSDDLWISISELAKKLPPMAGNTVSTDGKSPTRSAQ